MQALPHLLKYFSYVKIFVYIFNSQSINQRHEVRNNEFDFSFELSKYGNDAEWKTFSMSFFIHLQVIYMDVNF